MVKSELIKRIAAKLPDLSYQDVEMAVNRILERMSLALCSKDRIEIRGFGSWCVRYRDVRNAHNPKSGDRVLTKPKYTPHFKPGKEMRQRINDTMGTPIQSNDSEDDSEE